MNKTLSSIVFLTAFTLTLQAQVKMNFSLALQAKTQSSQEVKMFIKGEPSEVKRLLAQEGGTFYYSHGDISVASALPSSIGKICASKAVSRIEAYPQRISLLNDTMLINNNIIPVHDGTAPLAQAYDGTGIVMGFIDTGIDFTHPDFLDSAGKSRVKFLWDQNKPIAANTPMPYNYGQEWTNIQIDSGLAASHSDVPYSGHGTHVAGIGAGDGSATGNYKGAAPNADIIMVAMNFGSSSPTLIADAADYIFNKAQLLGKPCVINASLGDYYGSHDGLDLQAQIISNMIDAQPGRSFVAAAGNGGTTRFHLGYTVTADTNFTFFEGSSIYIPMYADTNDLKNVDFAIGADQTSPYYSFRGHIPFSDINDHLGVLKADTLYNGSNRIGIIQSYGDLNGGVYSMEFLITPDSAAYKWRLMCTGSGKFDCWTFDLFDGAITSSTEMDDSAYYKFPDFDKTIVSSFQCLDNVISVGNYTNRKTYIDYNNNLFVNTATNPGELHPTSSHGPTRDGRIKPDVCSPGDMTLAAIPLSMVPSIVSSYPDALAQGGYHVRNGGSSHSSPSVAGIAALYLQMDPSATAAEIKQDIICSAKNDAFTGALLPDNYWGYGKANAYGALVGCLSVGQEIHEEETAFTVYPNPNNGETMSISISTLNYSAENKIMIYNALGEEVLNLVAENGRYNISSLPSGAYFCCLFENGKRVGTKKIIIL
jgi:subtilisin family serine protease